MKQRLGNLVGWSFLSTVVASVLQIAQLAVIARVLGPSAVAVAAIFNVFLSFSWLLQDFGFSGYFVHRQTTSPTEEKGLYLATVLISIVLSGVVLFAAPWVATFYGESQLSGLLGLLALNILIISFYAQFQALVVRELRLAFLAQVEIASRFVGFFVLIGLLVLGKGLISIGIAVVTMSVTKAAVIIGSQKEHVRRLFRSPGFSPVSRSALSYGLYQVGAQIINQLRTQADVLIFGKALGLEGAGMYALAKELVLRPGRILQPVVGRVALPLYARLQREPTHQSASYLVSLRLVSYANGVLYVAIIALSMPAVLLLYGHEYRSVAYLVPVLALFGFLRTLGAPTGALAQANGKTGLDFRWNLVALGITVVFLLIVQGLPLMQIALGVSIMQLALTLFSYLMLVQPLSELSFRMFVDAWIGSAMALVVLAGVSHWRGASADWLLLGLASVLVAVHIYRFAREYRAIGRSPVLN